jgi:hypothetical protein
VLAFVSFTFHQAVRVKRHFLGGNHFFCEKLC